MIMARNVRRKAIFNRRGVQDHGIAVLVGPTWRTVLLRRLYDHPVAFIDCARDAMIIAAV
jgi:hypothetical protein